MNRGVRKLTNPRGGNMSKSQRSETNLRRLISGGAFSPSNTPPVIVSQPWNNATIMFTQQVKGDGNVQALNLSVLKTRMLSQLGFSTSTTTVDFDIKIHSLSVWCIEDATHLIVYPADFITGSSAELARVESHSMKNMYAKVGYHFPSHLQTATLTTSMIKTKDPMIMALASSKDTVTEIHIRLLWKGANTATAFEVSSYVYRPNTLRSRLDEMREMLDDIQLETEADFVANESVEST